MSTQKPFSLNSGMVSTKKLEKENKKKAKRKQKESKNNHLILRSRRNWKWRRLTIEYLDIV